MRQRADAIVDIEVRQARAEGATWAQIGSLLGSTRQAVQQRFGSTGYLLGLLADEAYQALKYGRREAKQLGHTYLGTEHLVLGLLQTSPKPDRECDRFTQIPVWLARQAVAEICGKSTVLGVAGKLRLAPRLRDVLVASAQHAAVDERLRVHTQDLLCGLIIEGGGVGLQILRGLGISDSQLSRDCPVHRASAHDL